MIARGRADWLRHPDRETSFDIRSEAFDVDFDELWEITRKEEPVEVAVTGKKGAFLREWKTLLSRYGVVLNRYEVPPDEESESWIAYQLASQDAFVAVRDLASPE